MATQYKTPGVYINEPDSFPPSIVGVETAIPCFIGFTERADDKDGRSLNQIPKKIVSMAEFRQAYGQGYSESYYLVPPSAIEAKTKAAKAAKDEEEAKAKTAELNDALAAASEPGKAKATADLQKAKEVEAEATAKRKAADELAAAEEGTSGASFKDKDWGVLTLDGVNFYHLFEAGTTSFNLFNSMRLFYANGGGTCYVISCGTYADGLSSEPIENALDICQMLIGPTMVVVPDAVLLAAGDYRKVAVHMLKTCARAQDRMAIFDVPGADQLGPGDDWEAKVESFREVIHSGTNPEEWRYGAAYFPPLVTAIVSADEIDITNFTSNAARIATLKAALTAIVADEYPPDPSEPQPKLAGPAPVTVREEEPGSNPPSRPPARAPRPATSAKGRAILDFVDQITPLVEPAEKEKALTARKAARKLTQDIGANLPAFKTLLAAAAATQGVLPPSGAMAGVWTANDTLRGVWNAPANVGIATMIRPLLPINGKQQEELNMPVTSLAVNAIRTFQGRGSLIWGARTLDSNSNDWRYIQVRRTMIYVEQSVKQALEAMVFKPNSAQTWVTVVAMIESFLHGLWASGGLMGASPAEAYNVQAGLGSTMTPQDVLEGVMRVHVTLQMIHPAEFIELTFKQQMLGGS